MAQEAQINIKINGGQAQKSLDDIGKKLISANAGLEKTIQRYGENSKAADKYRKTIAGLLVEQDKINKSLGNNGKQAQSLQAQYRALMKELGTLEQGTPQFEALRKKAAQLKDQMGDLAQEVRGLASDTRKLDFGIGVINGLSGAFGAVTGAAALFGVENEELEKSMQKLLAVSTLMNGVNTVAQTLNKSNVVGMELRAFWTKVTTTETIKNTAAQTGQNAATGAGVVTTNALGAAMKALPIVAIIAGIVALGAAIYKYTQYSKDAQQKEKELKKEKERLAAVRKKETEEIKKASEFIGKETAGLFGQIAILKQTNFQSKERRDLIKDINEKYGVNIKNIQDEKKFLSELNTVLDTYIQSKRLEFQLMSNSEKIQASFAKQEEAIMNIRKLNLGLNDNIIEGYLKGNFMLESVVNPEKFMKLTGEQLEMIQKSQKVYQNQEVALERLGAKYGKLTKQLKDTGIGDETQQKKVNEKVKDYSYLLDEINDKLNRQANAQKQLNQLTTDYEFGSNVYDSNKKRIEETTKSMLELVKVQTTISGGGGRIRFTLLDQLDFEIEEFRKKDREIQKRIEDLRIQAYSGSQKEIVDAGERQVTLRSQYSKKLLEIERKLNEDLESIIQPAIQKSIKTREEQYLKEVKDLDKRKLTKEQKEIELIVLEQNFTNDIYKIRSLGYDQLTDLEKKLYNDRKLIAGLTTKLAVETEKARTEIVVAQTKLTENEIANLIFENRILNQKTEIEQQKIGQNKKDKLLKELENKANAERKVRLKNNLKDELDLLNVQMVQELNNVDLTEQDREQIRTKYTALRLQKEKQFKDAVLTINKEMEVDRVKVFQESVAEIEQVFSKLGNGVMNIFNNINDLSRQRLDDNLRKVEQATNRELELYESMNKNKLLSDDELAAQKNQIEQRRLQEERKLKREQFNKDKKNNMANAIISGAQAVLQALASSLPPLNFIMAGLVGAATGVQISTIKQQEFTAKSGGIVPQNGLPSDVDSVKAKLAPGEAVINANSSSMFGPLLSMINQAGGGIPLVPQTGGGNMNVGSVNNEPQVVRAYVVEQDITDSQNRINRIKRSVEF